MDLDPAQMRGFEPMVLVNDRSGGQAGIAVAEALRARLGPEAVHTIAVCSPDEVARRCLDLGRQPLAAGGDGTVVALIEAVRAEARRRGVAAPPVAVLPLGTGNDLATTVGWPAGTGHEGRIDWCLNELRRRRWAWIDRFTLTGPGFHRAWYNYCSWGCDARVARHFHAMRRDQGWMFRSRVVNKAYYGIMGLVNHGEHLPLRDCSLGPVPAWARALVLTNVPYYAGGGRLCPRVRADDGRCDAFALGSGLLMGLGIRGLRQARRLGAVAGCSLGITRPLPMQLDGEPLAARPGRWVVAHTDQVRLAIYPGSVLGNGDGPRPV